MELFKSKLIVSALSANLQCTISRD